MLFENAYDIPPLEVWVSGTPEWMGNDAYAIEAKSENPSTQGQLQEMLQTLLKDRFKLQFHRESREVAGFALIAARNGPKLTEGTGQLEPTRFGVSMSNPSGSMQTTITAVNCDLAQLARALPNYSDQKPVLDRTGLQGHYNFTLGPFTRSDDPNSLGPSIFAVIQEQLGLKLESQKIPIQVYVIDHVSADARLAVDSDNSRTTDLFGVIR